MDSAKRHVFISYVSEDRDKAVALKDALEADGMAVWLDKDQLFPGQDWRLEIRRAIQNDNLAFLACFSEASASRPVSYQNEEIILAVEEYRQRPPGAQWIFPVRFDDVQPPEYDLGASRTLSSVQYTDLFGSGSMAALVRLARTLQQLINRAATVGTVATFRLPDEGGSGQTHIDRMIKTLVRDPNGDIALEELVMDLSRSLRAALADENAFPTVLPQDWLATERNWVELIAATLKKYEEVSAPLAAALRLAGLYGLPVHEHIWSSAVNAVTTDAWRGDGVNILREMRAYPVLILEYTACLAAVPRGNYGVLRAVAIEPAIRIMGKKVPPVAWCNVRTVEGNFKRLFSAAVELMDEGVSTGSMFDDSNEIRRRSVRHTPISDHLCETLWQRFEERFNDRESFEEAFDKAEVWLDVLASDEGARNRTYGQSWLGAGRYTWRHLYGDPPETALEGELELQGQQWTPLQHGLLGGDLDRAKTAIAKVGEIAARMRHDRSF